MVKIPIRHESLIAFFLLLQNKVDFSKAKQLCSDRGMSLLSNAEETRSLYKHILGQLRQLTIDKRTMVWVGAKLEKTGGEENIWRWQDGTSKNRYECFYLRPVSNADAKGLGTTIFPTPSFVGFVFQKASHDTYNDK
jgi:hypothetical protein